jgi:hypothetical protein
MLKYTYSYEGETAPNAGFKSPLDHPSAVSVSGRSHTFPGIWNMGDREIEVCVLVKNEDF